MSIQDDMRPDVPPPFVKLKPGATDTNITESWDGWAVEPTGVHKDDYLKGVEYADIALRKAIGTGSPAAVDFTLVTIVSKILNGVIKGGAMEKGFMERLISLAMDRRQQLDAN